MSDDWTINHLNAWLDNHVGGDEHCHEEIRNAMIKLAAEDPTYWHNQGWPILFAAAGGPEIVKQHRGVK